MGKLRLITLSDSKKGVKISNKKRKEKSTTIGLVNVLAILIRILESDWSDVGQPTPGFM